MKKVSIIVVSILMVVSISTASLAMSIDMNLDQTKDIKMNDTVIYTLKLSEKIIGASFKINYDSDQLELVGSGTTNLSASKNNGKIACVYFDMEKKAIDTCSIKFKAKKNMENTTLTFELEEAKFIALNGEKSYSQNDIAGIKKTITIEKSSASNSGNTGSTDKNPSNSNNSGNDNSGNDNSGNSSNNGSTNDNLNNSNNSNNASGNTNNSSNASGDTNSSNNSNNASSNTNNSNNVNNTSDSSNKLNNANQTNSSKTNTTNQSSVNNNSKGDSTLANAKLPKTGLNHYILIPICLVSMLAIYFFVKMKSRRE